MPRQGQKPREFQPDTRDCLVRAGLLCFARFGFDGTSIRQISTAAGKNSSLISYHFKNKDGLYREVFRQVLGRFCTGMPSDWKGPKGTPQVEREAGRLRLRDLITGLLRDVETHMRTGDALRDASVALFLSEIRAPRPEIRDLVSECVQPSVREFRKALQAIRPDLPKAEIDFWGITVHGTCISHALRGEFNRMVWTEADPGLSLEAMAERLTAFVYHGLMHI